MKNWLIIILLIILLLSFSCREESTLEESGSDGLVTLNDFYFDDVTGPGYGGGPVGDPVTLPVTFDCTR